MNNLTNVRTKGTYETAFVWPLTNPLLPAGKLKHADLDDRALDALKEFPTDGAIAVLAQFLESNLEHVSNKSAYLCGVMKTYRQKSRAGQHGGQNGPGGQGGSQNSLLKNSAGGGAAGGSNGSAGNSSGGVVTHKGPDEEKVSGHLDTV